MTNVIAVQYSSTIIVPVEVYRFTGVYRFGMVCLWMSIAVETVLEGNGPTIFFSLFQGAIVGYHAVFSATTFKVTFDT